MENQFWKNHSDYRTSNGLGNVREIIREQRGKSNHMRAEPGTWTTSKVGFQARMNTSFERSYRAVKVGELASLAKAKKRIDVILHVMGGGLGKRDH